MLRPIQRATPVRAEDDPALWLLRAGEPTQPAQWPRGRLNCAQSWKIGPISLAAPRHGIADLDFRLVFRRPLQDFFYGHVVTRAHNDGARPFRVAGMWLVFGTTAPFVFEFLAILLDDFPPADFPDLGAHLTRSSQHRRPP